MIEPNFGPKNVKIYRNENDFHIFGGSAIGNHFEKVCDGKYILLNSLKIC